MYIGGDLSIEPSYRGAISFNSQEKRRFSGRDTSMGNFRHWKADKCCFMYCKRSQSVPSDVKTKRCIFIFAKAKYQVYIYLFKILYREAKGIWDYDKMTL